MKVSIIKLRSGFYAVMFWDESRKDWSCWWSGSKRLEDAMREADKLLHYK